MDTKTKVRSVVEALAFLAAHLGPVFLTGPGGQHVLEHVTQAVTLAQTLEPLAEGLLPNK